MAKGTMSIRPLCLGSPDARLTSVMYKGKTRGPVENMCMSCTPCYLSFSWNFGHFLEFCSLVPLPLPLVLSELDILSPSQYCLRKV